MNNLDDDDVHVGGERGEEWGSEGQYGIIWGEEEGTADYGGVVQPGQVSNMLHHV